MTSRILAVVPAKAGTHNHGAKLLTSVYLQGKAARSVLNNIGRGVWVPAFAGTTERES